jgi:hypothetical protein
MTKIICTISLLSLLAIFACKKPQQAPQGDFDFSSKFSIKSEFDEAKSELLVTVNLDDSLHAYAPKEKFGKPIKIEISPKNGWSADGATVLPTGKKIELGSLGESIVYEGRIQLRQKLKKGDGVGEALLHLQVCTDKACDRPRIHPLPLKADRIEKIMH